MNYYIKTTVHGSAEVVDERVRAALTSEGFGVVTEMDVQATLKAKTGEDIGAYRILGACNPSFASKALSHEPYIGTMLPCNVVVRAVGEDEYEVAAVDPVASMQAIENAALAPVAVEVRDRLARVVAALAS